MIRVTRFNLILMLIYLFFISQNAQSEDMKEYYPFKDGNLWIYEVVESGTEEARRTIAKIKIEGKEYIDNTETTRMVDEEGNYSCIVAERDGIKLYKDVDKDRSYEIFDSPLLLFFLNIEHTKEHKDKYSYSGYDDNGNLDYNGVVDLEMKFEKKEDVIVPAGKFLNCIKVSQVEFWHSSDGSFAEGKSTIWFAKGVGKVKEIREEIGYEVKNGATYTDIEEYELKRAIVNGIEYGKGN